MAMSRGLDFAVCVCGTADVHEQAKPWVPLMLAASYRPSGWLGIMCVREFSHCTHELRFQSPYTRVRCGPAGAWRAQWD